MASRRFRGFRRWGLCVWGVQCAWVGSVSAQDDGSVVEASGEAAQPEVGDVVEVRLKSGRVVSGTYEPSDERRVRVRVDTFDVVVVERSQVAGIRVLSDEEIVASSEQATEVLEPVWVEPQALQVDLSAYGMTNRERGIMFGSTFAALVVPHASLIAIGIASSNRPEEEWVLPVPMFVAFVFSPLVLVPVVSLNTGRWMGLYDPRPHSEHRRDAIRQVFFASTAAFVGSFALNVGFERLRDGLGTTRALSFTLTRRATLFMGAVVGGATTFAYERFLRRHRFHQSSGVVHMPAHALSHVAT